MLSFQIFFAAHFIACFWFYLSNPHVTGVAPGYVHAGRDDDVAGMVSGIRTWTTEFGVSEATVVTQYIASLYWTFMTMLTVGYGDIHATNTGERFYSTLTMIFGAIMFGAIIAKVREGWVCLETHFNSHPASTNLSYCYRHPQPAHG